MPIVFDHLNNQFNQHLLIGNPALGPITVTQDGLLSDSGGNGLTLSGGVYTVTVNGALLSSAGAGLVMVDTLVPLASVSKVTVGDSGMISGSLHGLYSLHGLTVVNAGVIEGHALTGGVGIGGDGLAAFKITNTGTIRGDSYAIDHTGAGLHSITNSGEIQGSIRLGNGVDTIVNSGMINGYLYLFDGADTVTNSGLINGDLNVQSGNDKITNSGMINGAVEMGDGAVDTLTNSGTISQNVHSGTGNKIITNSGTIGGFVFTSSGNDVLINKGMIASAVETNDGKDTLTNSGTIASQVNMGNGNDTLTNSGTIDHRVLGGLGEDKVTNSGTIKRYVDMGADNDTFTNTGHVLDFITMGSGDDKFIGGKDGESLIDEAGSDSYLLGAGDDLFDAIGAGAGSGIDTIDGGTNKTVNFARENLGDVYRASTSGDLRINLDTVSHTVLDDTIAAGRAISGTGGTDLLKGIESAITGAGADIVFGSAGANYIATNEGRDLINGFGGNDWIDGGTGLDSILGGLGRDTLSGGEDTDFDRFIYLSAAESTVAIGGRDVIMDFGFGEDFLDFSQMHIANGHYIGVDVDFDGADGAMRMITTQTGYLVQLDINHDKKVDMAIELKDASHSASLYYGDFIF